MTFPHRRLSSSLSELTGLFNAQKTDLPDGALHKDCVFRLNGRAYHEQLGRPPSDPLIRLIGCGPAGYRLLLGALRYAAGTPELRIHGDGVEEVAQGNRARVLAARATLSGSLRTTHQPFTCECGLTLTAEPSGAISEIAVTMGDADVEMLLLARQSAG
jgi:hypothetical protein